MLFLSVTYAALPSDKVGNDHDQHDDAAPPTSGVLRGGDVTWGRSLGAALISDTLHRSIQRTVGSVRISASNVHRDNPALDCLFCLFQKTELQVAARS